MNLEHIKKQFEMVKDTETFVITTETVRELIEEVEHLKFENDLIRRNRTTQERKDFNRIKQLEAEIETLKSMSRLKTKYKMDENGNLERVTEDEDEELQ